MSTYLKKKLGNVNTGFFDTTAEIFNSKYDIQPDFKERERLWSDLIEKYTSREPGSLCLDLGCGSGHLSQFAFKKGMKVIGIDQSGEMLALARKKIRLDAKNGQVNFMKSSLPLPEDFSNQLANKVELILCSSVLEYISNFEEVLAQCYCMLKTDGKMIVSFPNRRSLYRSGERILKRLPIWKNSYLQYQKHQFEQNQIAGLMNRMSFKLLHTEYFALPFQRFLGHLLGASRHPRIATMFVVVIQKY